MEPDEYIKSFFQNIKSQLRETKMRSDGKSASYKNRVVAAAWSNQLWDVQLNTDNDPIRRQYDPANARSTESAANYFVDEMCKATGQEPPPRPEVITRHGRGRPRT